MAGRQAKILAPTALARMLNLTKHHSNPARSQAIILLSVKAGLRAAEIAKLEWPMVLDATGRVADVMAIEDRIAKKRSGRRIPIHPDLKDVLIRLRNQATDDGSVIRSRQGSHMKPNSIVNWFVILYRETGLDGCSSHSGRRTFLTTAAKMVHKAGGSLRDVQLLAGHKSIETTQRYLDGDSHAQRRLVSLI
jgi:integrase/recombinase XerD